MKNINLYVNGTYDSKTTNGTWKFYLEYNGAVMKRSGYMSNAISFTRMCLYSIIQALSHINEPCNICIHAKAPLGFNNIKKSRNADFLMEIQHLMVRMGHTFTIDKNYDDNKINNWEKTYSTNKTKQNTKKETKADYDKIIEEQAMQSKDWREMYSDLMGPSQGCWVEGSGGY